MPNRQLECSEALATSRIVLFTCKKTIRLSIHCDWTLVACAEKSLRITGDPQGSERVHMKKKTGRYIKFSSLK